MGIKSKGFGKQSWLLLLAAGGVLLYQQLFKNDSLSTTSQGENYVQELLTDQKLVYTEHAKCRMKCRTISSKEVEHILTTGTVNWRKSETEPESEFHCPSYALEGNTEDGQNVRIVFADCDKETKVITAIDLDNEYDCYCK